MHAMFISLVVAHLLCSSWLVFGCVEFVLACVLFVCLAWRDVSPLVWFMRVLLLVVLPGLCCLARLVLNCCFANCCVCPCGV